VNPKVVAEKAAGARAGVKAMAAIGRARSRANRQAMAGAIIHLEASKIGRLQRADFPFAGAQFRKKGTRERLVLFWFFS